MCERLILDGRSYICGDCWQELLAHRATWPPTMTKGDVYNAIEAFMDTRPGSNLQLGTDGIEEEFRRLTGGSR